MDLWQKLEDLIPVGEETGLVAALRKKTKESSGDEQSMQHMALCRFYQDESRKRRLMSPLLLNIAKRHLEQAIRTARYYPDPLSERARMLEKRGDLFDAAEQFQKVIPGYRVWIETFKDPDGSRQEQLCIDLARTGALCNVLGKFSDGFYYNMEGLKEFRKLPADTCTRQTALEEAMLSGTMRALLAQFRYEEALFFVDLALKDKMFWSYQSDVYIQLRAQQQVLPELVARTKGYEFPKEGLKLWADLMEDVQRCKSPDEAREVKRKIMDRIERHETTQQVQDLENAVVALLRKNYGSPVLGPTQANAAAPPPADLSAVTDPKWREAFEKVNLVIERLRTDSQRRSAEIREDIRKTDEFMQALNEAAIEHIHQKSSVLYRVPGWFRRRWNIRIVLRLAVLFVALDFLIGKVLEKVLESNSPSLLERLHFSLSEGLITAGIAILLFFLSIPAEKKIDDLFLDNYKHLLHRLVADRVALYWATYNSLLRIFAGCQAGIAKLRAGMPATGQNPPATGQQAP